MRKFSTLACLLGLALKAWGQIGENREWTSSDGRTIEAELVSVSENKVEVRKGGKLVSITLDMLSQADRDFALGILTEQKKAAERADALENGKHADAMKSEWIRYDADEGGLIYQLFVGKRVKKDDSIPLFVHLHGAGARAEDVKVGHVEIAAKTVASEEFYRSGKNQCVICVPLCPPEPETWPKQVAKLEALIDNLIATLPVDTSRIYLSGYSQGGQGIGKLLQSRPDFYAGAIFADGGPADNWIGKVKTPMWSYFSPERDSSKAEAQKEKFAANGVEYRFDVFPDSVHNNIHWKMAKSEEVFEWLFEQKKS
ncbi:hypothetical protein [Roseibacillus persicicus]|uniref:carboxylesterase family protein n=1 Tax=Roseibacillus persicicus TaxID=454148 RepID=UPI00280C77C3|nr:hypothetical protein [Roseibacillus persicicus]MDQ8189430.1 hypothetical protein [Roseibacillus persicicus]